MMKRALVTGAGGFIGNELVNYLVGLGYRVTGTDLKLPEFNPTRAHDFLEGDLRDAAWARYVLDSSEAEEVYALAADMGGMGFISAHSADVFYNNAMINLNTLEAARLSSRTQRYFFASSACVYPVSKQQRTDGLGLKESDAYPAQPEDAYGWEKLMTERLCEYYRKDYGMDISVARFHNIFGPYGVWDGGREKAPAAVCRKIAEAKLAGRHEIEIWGDGEQMRSFCFVFDCVVAVHNLVQVGHNAPVNIGQDRAVSINQLVAMVSKVAHWPVTVQHVRGPQGVRGRNSDNTLVRQLLGWEPIVSLERGLKETYEWIEERVRERIACGA